MSDHDSIGDMEPVLRGASKDPNILGEVDRLGRSLEAREERGSRDEGGTTDEDRLEIFRNAFMQGALPSLPALAGWHVCWVSTTNERDTIPLRLSLGYQLVTQEEVAGWTGGNITTIKSGELAGCVNHNEMVAMKIRQELYERYMQEAHHNAPANEDRKLIYNAERNAEVARSYGGDIVVGDGLEEIKRTASVGRGRFN